LDFAIEEAKMNEQKYRYLAWGMLLGMSIGSSIAMMMYGVTGETSHFGLIGIGPALGLGLGAALDRREHSAQD
jgi:hypothetical protein